MVKYNLIAFLIFISFTGSAQDVNYDLFNGRPVKVSIPVRLDQPYFLEYKDTSYLPLRLIYSAGFNSSSTPENLVLSAYSNSLNNLGQVPRYNGPIPDTTRRNGLILIHKLTFFWQNTETAIIKLAEMKDSLIGNPVTVQLQHINNYWQPADIDEVKNIEAVMLSIRTNMFWELHNRASELPAVKEAYLSVKDEEGLLNVDMLSNYLKNLKNIDRVRYNLFCDD